MDLSTFPLAGGGLGVFQIRGNPHSKAERMLDYEAGYRTRIGTRISMDITGFRSHYGRLATIESAPPFFATTPPPPHLVQPAFWDNLGRGRSYGAEVFTNLQIHTRWRIGSGFSFLQMKLFRDAASNDFAFEPSSGNSPKQQTQVRSMVNLPGNLEWDVSAFHVSRLRIYLGGLSNVPVPGYIRLDTRLGWRAGERIDFSIGGQNLLSPRHMEFSQAYHVHATQAQRSILGKVTWRF